MSDSFVRKSFVHKSFVRRIWFAFAFAAVALLAAAGCQPADPVANTPSGAKKVAVYEGGEITRGELQEQLDLYAQQSGGGEITPDSPQYDMALSQVMPQLTAIEMSTAYAREQKISVSGEDIDKGVDEQIERLKDQVAGQAAQQGQDVGREEAFKKALQGANLTEKELRKNIREQIPNQILIQKVQERVVGNTELSREDIEKYYKENKAAQFTTPPQRCARHILFNKDQEDKAAEVKEQLESGDGDFAALAKEFSQDPGSAEKGGDLGCVGKGQTVPDFEKAVFEAEKGQILGPIKTEFGYHVIQVTEIKEEKAISLEEATPQIKQQLQGEREAQQFNEWVNKQKERRDLRYLPGYKPKAAPTAAPTPAPSSASPSAAPRGG